MYDRQNLDAVQYKATLVNKSESIYRHKTYTLVRGYAALAAGFLHRVFVTPNVRVMREADLAEMLEDELFALHEQLGEQAYPKAAADYLNDWCAPDKGWLRKFYKSGAD